MAVKGYSERGIFSSIVYFLDDNKNHIYDFLKILGISVQDGNYDYIFLIEQSFSDFGVSDLVIIIIDKQTKKRTVVFVEGKVKTYQGQFSLEKEFDIINNALRNNKTGSVSSNLFVQLYYKNLLVTTKGEGNPSDKPIFLKTDRKNKAKSICRRLGDNVIVKKAFTDYIDDAEDYYYVAILPEQTSIDIFHTYIKKLGLIPNWSKTSCCWWGDIEKYFISINADKVIEVFNFNRYNTVSQIY